MQRSIAILGLALSGTSGFGCGTAQEEIYSETQFALAEGTGEACSGASLSSGEIEVDERSDECGVSQFCVSAGEGLEGLPPTSGVCSCRCDGPEGRGPFCACTAGFTCTALIEDLGLGDVYFAGSYCLAVED